MAKQKQFLWLPVLALGLSAMLFAAPSFAADDGQKLFTEAKCNNCHQIEKLGIERKLPNEKMWGPDLGATEHDAAWIKQFVLKEVDLHEKKHLNNYKGTEKDLETIAAWLVSLKSQ